MFKFFYIFLYKYSSYVVKSCDYQSTANLPINQKHTLFFNTANIDHVSFTGIKKKKIIFLKKKFFFFRFLSKPLILYKNIRKHYKIISSGISDHKLNFKSNSSKLVRGCFTTIRGRKPVRNLYYKISRSRPLISSFGKEFKSNSSISSFVKKSHYVSLSKDSYLSKYYNRWLVDLNNPLVCFGYSESQLLYYFKRRPFNFSRALKKKRKLKGRRRGSRRNLHILSYLFKSSRVNKLFALFRSKKLLLTYFMWYNITNILSKTYKGYFLNKQTSYALFRNKLIFNSNLTGVTLTKTTNQSRITSLKDSFFYLNPVSVYNLKTYNWLITI